MQKIRKFSAREVDSKVYYVKSSEEGLQLIKKKRYNKIHFFLKLDWVWYPKLKFYLRESTRDRMDG